MNMQNIPLIGETREERARRLLEEQIDRRTDATDVWYCVQMVDAVLQKMPERHRTLAILYTSRVLASRFREALNEEQQSKQQPH